MKNEIEAALSELEGQPLVASSRVGDIETFQFGGSQGRATFALQVSCPWRLTSGMTIVAGYDDVRYPKGNPSAEPPGFRWDAEGANRRDERLESFFEDLRAAPPTVTSLEADDLGSLRLALDQDVRLELFLDDVTDSERWRFFRPATDGPHFLVTGGGCDTVVG
jgi:hypothetical protein